ncbi:2-dehydropantoate 2-reductase [Sphingomonas colocasiae]|uniref:2-dehydropantoate 2-reductase n=1 Tax=Sphingomonas colocasiae TaxID=1848973 RepID=A0ABS7PKH8_9SPHN|nr:2-dehydropantoate 2-reductase [Sphingomonas colocasiae]MBY8821795.1 2-dehydropantoate 2-reductase [Sphingomonas colocasiae]
MKVGIVGAGAIGGWIGAALAAAGSPVSVLARGATLEAVRANGLILDQESGQIAPRVAASANAAELGPQELLVIAVKAPALREAAQAARPLISRDTIIVPMLNGVPWWFLDDRPDLRPASLDPEGSIGAALPADQVIGCVVHASCSTIEPGVIRRHFGKGLILGEPSHAVTGRLERVSALFRDALLDVSVSERIQQDIWYKLWGNMTMNPISALTRATADRILDDELVAAFTLRIMAEAAAIGAAIGCPITESGEDRMLVTRKLGAFKTSMLQDVEAGRDIEIEALLGAPRAIGAQAGIPTPYMDALLGMTRLFDRCRIERR